MKPILISCIPILALAAFQCAAAEQQISAPELAGPSAEPDTAAAVERVKGALRSAGGSAAKVTVSSHANTILIAGKVGTTADAQRIKAEAETAAQGLSVSSQIEVDAERQAVVQQQSTQLVRDVEAALRSDRATADLRLFVSVDDQQRVVLFGPVPNAQARTAAERVAAKVPGVKRIDNRLATPAD